MCAWEVVAVGERVALCEIRKHGRILVRHRTGCCQWAHRLLPIGSAWFADRLSVVVRIHSTSRPHQPSATSAKALGPVMLSYDVDTIPTCVCAVTISSTWHFAPACQFIHLPGRPRHRSMLDPSQCGFTKQVTGHDISRNLSDFFSESPVVTARSVRVMPIDVDRHNVVNAVLEDEHDTDGAEELVCGRQQ